uniref:Mitochondrial carrier protein n=1 Tax=Hemiselmis andersenii TaxID=464988 RepID=A0A6U4RVQ6_HEMAN|mmetsp:Transcript_35608/g.83398  ORF Transcript_35608/g.83398 Transcript_35608/m.83398 type:complete len:412 (+) Transcript_35608:125-1360(+)
MRLIEEMANTTHGGWLARRPAELRTTRLPDTMSATTMACRQSLLLGGGKRPASRTAAISSAQTRTSTRRDASPAVISVPSAEEHQPVRVASAFELSLELVDFAAGCAGGCVGVFVGHPFDTIKTRMQYGSGTSAATLFRQQMKREGIRSLAKGIETPLIGNVPVQAIVFGTYGAILRRLGAHYGDGLNGEDQPIWQHVAAGAGAGIFQAPAVTVAEYCKTQMQLQIETKSRQEVKTSAGGTRQVSNSGGVGKAPKVLYANSLDCASYVVRHHGPQAIFRGLCITLIRDVTYGQWFGQYEWTKRWLMRGHEAESPLFPIYSALAGGVAGVCGWVIIFPVDSVKTRIQARQASEPTYKIADCLRTMAREEPMGRAFTRGLGVCLVRALPVNAVTFLTYEGVMALGQELHAQGL